MELLFESWRNYLNEISFSAASAFDFDGPHSDHEGDFSEGAFVYRFSDHSDEEYKVIFEPKNRRDIISWDIAYKTEYGEYYELTGKNIVVKVMATVAQIILDFIKRSWDPHRKRIFYFSGALSPGEMMVGKVQQGELRQSAGKRARLYTTMLRRLLPAGWDMSENEETPNAILFFNEKELGTLSQDEQDFISLIGGDIEDIKNKIKQPGIQDTPEEKENETPI
jgi:hypothetical protein